MIIRPAQVEDVDALHYLISAQAAVDTHTRLLTSEQLQHTLFCSQAYVEALLVEQPQQALGYAMFHMTFCTRSGTAGLHLNDLFILPTVQGQGIGRHLMRHVAQLARERACTRIEWWQTSSNTLALALIDGMGLQRRSGDTLFSLEGERLRNF
jgi:GNAT superfamily N-acetyltransferase